MRYFRYLPETNTPLSVPLENGVTLDWLAGEALFLSDIEEEYILQHPIFQHLMSMGQMKTFEPIPGKGFSSLGNYSENDAEEILSGIYDLGILEEFLITEKDPELELKISKRAALLEDSGVKKFITMPSGLSNKITYASKVANVLYSRTKQNTRESFMRQFR